MALGDFKGTCNFLFLKLNSEYTSVCGIILYCCLYSLCAYFKKKKKLMSLHMYLFIQPMYWSCNQENQI